MDIRRVLYGDNEPISLGLDASTERLNQNPEAAQPKRQGNLKKILGEMLRLPDLYINSLTLLNLKKRDIPQDYQSRDLIDIGSGSGIRYGEIMSLFQPRSYTGIDNDSDAVKVGKRKMLNIQQLDFVDEDLKGDLGVAFGTHTTPEVIDKLREGFNLLVFNKYARTAEEAEGLIKSFQDKLGAAAFDKILTKRRSIVSVTMGSGYEIYFFLKTNEGTEHGQQP